MNEETQISIAVESHQIEAAYKTAGIDKIIAAITGAAKSRAETCDPSTDSGRKEIASIAYQVARSKTAIDDQGKQLGEGYRKIVLSLNEDRRKAREALDALKDEIRQPVTEYEKREEDRIEGHHAAIAFIENAGRDLDEVIDIAALQNRHKAAKSTFEQRDWQEFAKRAGETFELTAGRIEKAIAQREAEAQAKAEAEAKAKAEAERLQKEREERIAKEAAERAKREAEAEAGRKAKAEAERIEAERRREREEAERKEREAKERDERIRREHAEAERKREEAERIKAKQAAEAEEKRKWEADQKAKAEAKRIANKAHREKVRSESALHLVDAASLSREKADEIVKCIEAGEIKNVSIQF